MDQDYIKYLKEKGCCNYKEVEVPILKDGICKFEKKMAEVYDVTPEIVQEYAKLKNIPYEVLIAFI